MQKYNPMLLQMNELGCEWMLVLWKIVLGIFGCAQKLWGDEEYGSMVWSDLGYERMMPEWQVACVAERARDGWKATPKHKNFCA